MSIRAITFDFWGTLFADRDSELRHAIRIDAFTTASGLPRDSVDTALHAAQKEFFRVHVEEQRTLLPMHAVEMVCQSLECTLPHDVKQRLAHIFGTVILQHPPALIEHALEAVQAAAARYPVALISDSGISPGSSLSQLLDRFGFADHLQIRTFSDQVGVAKPQATMFEETARKLGILPHEIFHIGDLEPTDIAGIQSVGGAAGLFAAVNRRFVETTRAEVTYHSWREFIDKIDQLPANH